MKLFKKKPLDRVKEARKKKRKKIQRIIDLIFIIAFVGYTFIPIGLAQFKVKNFDKYAKNVEDIKVPDVKIVALGEATHGNSEFQELKLTVFKNLVDDGYHAFALESDYGDCAVINDWLQGGEGTVDEMTDTLSFRIYKTEKMKELLSWMHDYNETANESDKIRFYGYDLQRMTNSANHILSYCKNNNLSDIDAYSKMLEKMEMPQDYYTKEQAEPILTDIDSVRQILKDNSDEENPEYRRAVHEADCLYNAVIMNEDSKEYGNVRDKYMAENTDWIIEEEERLGNNHIFITGHNGHVAKKDKTRKAMGEYLAEKYQDDYFVIGTDFYETNCNMPSLTGERDVKHFISADPLAAQLKNMDSNMEYLDYASVPKSEKKLYKMIHSKMIEGSLGEAYTPIMKILPYTYRTNYVPTELYNGMIYVYNATPTDCK